MRFIKVEWLNALRERGAGAKVAVGVGTLALAGLIALAGGPRRPAPLAEILTAVSNSDVDRVRDLASSRAAVRAVDLDGNTPLHIAAQLGSGELVRVLIDAGADLSAKNRHGQTPLVAALSGNGNPSAAVQELLAAGASRDDGLPAGDTLLHVAAANPDLSPRVLDVLADPPAAADAKNAAGETPLQIAERAGRPRMVHAIRRLKAGRLTSAPDDTRASAGAR